MNVLITGINSLLGDALNRTAPDGVMVRGTYYNDPPDQCGPNYFMNLTDYKTVEQTFRDFRPDLVIHSAAEGNVDLAERDYKQSYRVNCQGTSMIIDECCKNATKLVFISTNAVFSGKNPPYYEYSNPDPINAYGRIKHEAELCVWRAASDRGLPVTVFRPIMLYGWEKINHRKNWATIVIDKLKKGESLKLVDDVFCQPTFVDDAAAAMWRLIDRDLSIFHIAAPQRMSFYEFGLLVARAFDLDHTLIERASVADFPGLAPRPKDTTFDVSKLKSEGIVLSNAEEGLEKMKQLRLL